MDNATRDYLDSLSICPLCEEVTASLVEWAHRGKPWTAVCPRCSVAFKDRIAQSEATRVAPKATVKLARSGPRQLRERVLSGRA